MVWCNHLNDKLSAGRLQNVAGGSQTAHNQMILAEVDLWCLNAFVYRRSSIFRPV